MKTVIKVFAILMVFTTIANAQDFTGVATYKTKRKIDIQLDSSQVNSEMHQKMMDMLKKQFEKTFILSFNKEESIYKEEEKLGAPQMGGMQMVVVNTGGSDILYKNTKEERYTNQNDVFGKVFLIKDQLKKEDWQFESDTKNIGEYTCYKATITREQPKLVSGISVNGDKDLSQEREPEMETVTVTAWYTPQIPINNGPANYFGLPGLILEVNDGSETIICSKIVMNPADKVEITEPKKGKEVTQEEFDKIMEKKLKEMEERYNSERGDGHNIEIKIGG
ncbi:GLPGLI family protein [Mangrovimonas sp. DI 80]|uniref:GLPGLI family protein n=1 Tax=Mangrovimonas sp. DI 80 TaxID=1779330 RepID=UPI0009785390|nr:GLPGLI family protein [Mangrovimonas sp. DI 80]OMP31493.1 GLPGLI family protein [Mangrovimonas sp. DI 80]